VLVIGMTQRWQGKLITTVLYQPNPKLAAKKKLKQQQQQLHQQQQ
jgi:hypothetical protein